MHLVHLSTAQQAEKDRLESIISSGAQTFKEVGDALAIISVSRLYADEFETFEEYVQKKWQMGTRRAQQMIAAAKVVDNVRTIVRLPNEGVARVFAKLPAKDQIEVAKGTAKLPSNRVTAANVEAIAQRLSDYPLPHPKNHPEMNLNLAPKMSDVAKAQAQAMISEWYAGQKQHLNSHPPATPEVMVRRILNLFR